MSKKIILLFWFFSSIYIGLSASAQAVVDPMAQITGSPLILDGAVVHKYQSQLVPNQIYEIRVGLPESYQYSPEKDYPIIVVLDGQWNFTLAKDIASKLAYDGMMPEAITVGITWGGEGDNPSILRFRDFLRPELPFLPMSGGASSFLSSLTDELIPFVETLYRVADKRVLLGVSLGGLFTSYAMVEKPGYFNGYIAIAGSYFADSSYLQEKVELLRDSDALTNVRSYLSVGSLDGNLNFVSQLNEVIQSAKISGFNNKYKVFKGVGHAGVEPSAYAYGLQYIFKRPFLKLDETFLHKYSGDFEGGPEGQPPFPITVSVAGRGTLAIGDQNQSNEYLAQSKTQFYINGINVSVTFSDSDHFEVNSQGTILSFARIGVE